MITRFVVNPVAGRGRTRQLWPLLVQQLPKELTYDVVETSRVGEAEDIARAAADAGIDRLIVVGGDGTVSEAAQGLLGSSTALGFLPTGSACDLARSVGLPQRALSALPVVLSASPRKIDVGMANGRPFLNVAGVGLDAEVAARVNADRNDRSTGTWLYVKCLLRVLRTYRPQELRIDIDGRVLDGRYLLVAIGNAQYYGGGMRIVPTAQLTDGYLDILVVGDLNVPQTLGLLPRVFGGGHRFHPRCAVYRGRRVRIEAAGTPLLAHVDGEGHETTPLEVTVLPCALSLLAPVPHLGTKGREPLPQA